MNSNQQFSSEKSLNNNIAKTDVMKLVNKIYFTTQESHTEQSQSSNGQNQKQADNIQKE